MPTKKKHKETVDSKDGCHSSNSHPESRESVNNLRYTCPMHPEIVRIHPGNCPICGMALEPTTVTTDIVLNNELMDMTRRFWVSVMFTLPILFLTMGLHITGISSIIHLISPSVSAWVQFILATIVTIWCGWPLLKQGFLSIIQRHLVGIEPLVFFKSWLMKGIYTLQCLHRMNHHLYIQLS